jgi:hypothetical protein
MYDYCAIGLIHHLEIPTWIWLNGGALMDHVAHSLGVPSPASFVPCMICIGYSYPNSKPFPAMMMDAGDQLNFVQRMKSLFGSVLFSIIHPK